MANPSRWVGSSRRRRVSRRLAIGLLTCAIVVAWFAFLPPTTPKKPLPDPNGYDDLVRAGSIIDEIGPNKGDWKGAELGELRTFVAANQSAVDLAQLGVSREGVVHFADSEAGLQEQVDQSGQIRSLSRLILAQGRVAESDGRFGDAARADFLLLEVGQAATQGAMAVVAPVGWVIQWQAVDQLRRLRDHLPAPELHASIQHLEQLDRRRVSLKAIVDLWERWYADGFSLWRRFPMYLSGMEAKGRTDQAKMVGVSRDRIERSMRFLIVEWAIHLHHEETGRWPRSIAEMVPSILCEVPTNPATGQPMTYPANPSGELTDDLSSIGQGDGSTDSIEAAPKP